MKKTLFTVFYILFMDGIVHADTSAQYIGRTLCEGCHQQQVKLWTGSHHDLAMQHVDESTVLGDFTGVEFQYAGVTSRFYRKQKKFMVRTDGVDGKLVDYEIKYVFGVDPLQQYLVELDKGRLQALSIAWDARPKNEGGQRWFHLYPDEKITYKDELHWTRPSFNWNGMCAECHSTNLKKNYDSGSGSFKTSWSEIDVSCEACHGPASNHVTWAKRKPAERSDDRKGFAFLFDERKDVDWTIDKNTGNATRSKVRHGNKEIEVCAQCHSRRSAISDIYMPGKSFADHYKLRLLDEGMYFSDGQIQDEVYVYGSFLQSKMYHRGVTCSDCHEPHSVQLRQTDNGVCLQCHEARKFDSKSHHFHDMDTDGASCAECHMPPRDYMVIDPRHDHSIRIPRPDLSVVLGTPNACNQCHQDKGSEWSADHVKRWYNEPRSGYQSYAGAIDAGRLGKNHAAEKLEKQIRSITTPTIAKATAITLMPRYFDQSNISLIQDGLKNEDVLVRLASVSTLESLPQALLVQLAFPLLDDPVRSVRIEAARVLAEIKPGQLQGEHLHVYDTAAKEYIDSQLVNADRPEAQLNLGNYFAKQGDIEKAVLAYTTAIKLDDAFVPAYINLADFYRAQGSEDKAERTLRVALQMSPDNAESHYALGLLQIRRKQIDEAIKSLQRAAGIDSMNAHYVYVYAVALNSAGQNDLAIDVLQDADKRFPGDVNILEALIAFHRDAGNDFTAQTYMNKLNKLRE